MIVNMLKDFKLLIVSVFFISAIYKNIAKIIVMIAIEVSFLRFIEIISIKINPIIGRGIEPNIINFKYSFPS